MLDSNGASEVASGEGWLNDVNLVVSNSMRFEGWEAVKEKNESRKEGETEVYVVTDKWVDRSLVLGKTQSYVQSFVMKKKVNIILQSLPLLCRPFFNILRCNSLRDLSSPL